MKVAFLFPGQGAQRVGMGAELTREFAAARLAFDEADEALDMRLSRLCFEGPEEELRLTTNTQPAILATSIAALRAFEAEYGVTPEVAAGHSLGEYTALVAAGALDFPAALRAVRERGRLMQEACPPGEGSMAALIGLDLAAVKAICEEVTGGGELAVPANLNAPGQIVIAGHVGAVRRAIEIARARGAAMSVELKVSAPFHCPLMEPARVGMEPVIAALDVRPPRFPVIANVTAEINSDPAQIKPLLLAQITAPVRWEESMGRLAATGAISAVEFGAGRVLAGLMRRINKGFKVWPVEDPTSLRAAGQAVAEPVA
ncbi:MAG TPA: ACP S-malonyltransferase [Candidatus Binataceae bacterium]|jgi:[acyl-carrier-protein] S-malonyltransferase|nr:ACP S-malonyltransferase [Candidatus Binataceae bacterium]